LRIGHRDDFSVPGDIAIPRHPVRGFRQDFTLAHNNGAKWILALFRGLRRQGETSPHHPLVEGWWLTPLPSRVIFSFAYGGEEIWSHLASTVCGQACSQLNSRIFARRRIAVELDGGLMTISTLALNDLCRSRGEHDRHIEIRQEGYLSLGTAPT
jgi:hypothetical protein